MNEGEPALERLLNARGFVFDLDGTLARVSRRQDGLGIYEGAAELLSLLNERDIPFVVLTNGTSREPKTYERMLTAAGLPVRASRIMTPASIAADHFLACGMKRVMVLGIEGVWRPLRDAGLEVVLPSEGPVDPEIPVDAVFAGWYREFMLDEIEAACNAVWGGAKLFAASLVPFFATPERRVIGSSHAICAMITSITSVDAVAVGKPAPVALTGASARLGHSAADIAVVGSQNGLDARMALEGGATAVAIRSAQAATTAQPREQEAHLLLDDMNALLELLTQQEERPNG